MTPKEIDEILKEAAAGDAVSEDVEVARLERAKRPILASLRPVRPLAPAWVLAAGFLTVFAVVAFAGASGLGMYGLHALNATERAIIFSAVTGAACFAAVAGAREMRPAGGRSIAGPAFAVASAGLVLMFALLFHDYGMQKFVRQGVPCLVAGLSFAVPAAFLICLLVRRGFVLNLAAAGVAAGTLAGLAGIGVLELHCPNLKAMHIMVWHIAVVAISGIAGLVIGRVLQRWSRR